MLLLSFTILLPEGEKEDSFLQAKKKEPHFSQERCIESIYALAIKNVNQLKIEVRYIYMRYYGLKVRYSLALLGPLAHAWLSLVLYIPKTITFIELYNYVLHILQI
jgi:hypothetical protein